MQPQYAPQFPQAPAPQYPQQYPPQPAAPQYPQQPPAYPAPAYPAPQYPPAYNGNGHMGAVVSGQYHQYPPAPPAPPLPTGTLDSFYEQPSAGGGPSFKFMDANRNPLIGHSYVGIVARPVTNADIRAQTGNDGRPATFKDGRPKFVMVVPMQVQPSQEFPDGQAGWWVKGQARDELARAMAEAGAPAGPPEAGAAIRVTLVSTRAVPNMNPAFVYRVEYVRPQGAAPVPAQPAVALAPQPAPAQFPQHIDQQGLGQYAPAGAQFTSNPWEGQPQPVTPQVQPAYVPGMEGGMVPALNIGPTVTPPMVPQVAPQPVAQPAQAAPPGFSDEQAALFAKLTGGTPQG